LQKCKTKEKHNFPITVEYEIFPSFTQNQKEANYISNNWKKKQVRLIKPTKVKTMKETLKEFREKIAKWKSDLSNSRDSTNNYLKYLNANSSTIPAKKFAKYKGRAKFTIEEINKQIKKVITHEELIEEFESI
jgi:response regulator of citrate/malate metabolism